MKKIITYLFITICLFAFTASFLFSQEDTEIVTLRTLPVDWYVYAGAGVKLQYRNFNDIPKIVYIPISFEKKLFRYVESPKDFGDLQGIPLLLVHIKGQEILFVDLYTRYMKKDGLITDFSQEDLENFKIAEEKGSIEIIFQ